MKFDVLMSDKVVDKHIDATTAVECYVAKGSRSSALVLLNSLLMGRLLSISPGVRVRRVA